MLEQIEHMIHCQKHCHCHCTEDEKDCSKDVNEKPLLEDIFREELLRGKAMLKGPEPEHK